MLYRKRTSPIKKSSFDALLIELTNYNKIMHTSEKSGTTTVYDINAEIVDSLKSLHYFMINILAQVSKEIEFSYEINTKLVNDVKYCGIPWIKLYYKDIYFAYYGLSQNKKLWISKILPENKQVASLEIFEIESIEQYELQIIEEYKKIIKIIESKNNA